MRQGRFPLPACPPWDLGSSFSSILSLLTLRSTLPLSWGKEDWGIVMVLLLVNVSEVMPPQEALSFPLVFILKSSMSVLAEINNHGY